MGVGGARKKPGRHLMLTIKISKLGVMRSDLTEKKIHGNKNPLIMHRNSGIIKVCASRIWTL